MIKKLIGTALVALPFVGIFTYICIMGDVIKAVATFGAAIGVSLVLLAGVRLLIP